MLTLNLYRAYKLNKAKMRCRKNRPRDDESASLYRHMLLNAFSVLVKTIIRRAMIAMTKQAMCCLKTDKRGFFRVLWIV